MPYSFSAFGVLPPLWSSAAMNPAPLLAFVYWSSCMFISLPAALSWHCLGPSHMSLEAQRRRHLAVAVPKIAVARLVAAGSRQQRTQPKYPDVTDDRPLSMRGL